MNDMYYNSNAGLKPLVVSDEILHEALDVMHGEFTSVHKSKFHGAFVAPTSTPSTRRLLGVTRLTG